MKRIRVKYYLLAALMAVGIVLFSIFVYRWATEGFVYATHKYPDSRAMPDLGAALQEQEYESLRFASVSYEASPDDPQQILKIFFTTRQRCTAEVFIQDALDIRAVTEQFMAQHPERFEGQHVYVTLNGWGGGWLFPDYICFRNYDVDHGAKVEAGGLGYGKFQLTRAEFSMLRRAGGFTGLDLRGFQPPEDLSAFDGMATLRTLELHTNSMGNPLYEIPQEALDAFTKQHPGCKLSGIKANNEKDDKHEAERKGRADL